MKFSDYYYQSKPMYIILEIDEPDLPEDVKSIQEGIWQDAKQGDFVYRLDPPAPDKKIQRHVHIAHKKHKKSPAKQVSWNQDGSRHDKHNFDSSITGIKAAQDIAAKVLGLSSDVLLEHDLEMGTNPVLLESVSYEVTEPIVLLRKMGNRPLLG